MLPLNYTFSQKQRHRTGVNSFSSVFTVYVHMLKVVFFLSRRPCRSLFAVHCDLITKVIVLTPELKVTLSTWLSATIKPL